jgi:5-methyltetrahydrofolate--homocysteine methyltransferase
MERAIKAIRETDLGDHVRIIVDGQSVTAEYAKQISADGYAPDASQAAIFVKGFIA